MIRNKQKETPDLNSALHSLKNIGSLEHIGFEFIEMNINEDLHQAICDLLLNQVGFSELTLSIRKNNGLPKTGFSVLKDILRAARRIAKLSLDFKSSEVWISDELPIIFEELLAMPMLTSFSFTFGNCSIGSLNPGRQIGEIISKLRRLSYLESTLSYWQDLNQEFLPIFEALRSLEKLVELRLILSKSRIYDDEVFQLFDIVLPLPSLAKMKLDLYWAQNITEQCLEGVCKMLKRQTKVPEIEIDFTGATLNTNQMLNLYEELPPLPEDTTQTSRKKGKKCNLF
eukprot:TRINITY_DN9839_c0_g2_i4.p1 TRINITY_DN9839_c0_g2~~TRINITY_DN9839_c0_g2_i4.p1  ORF type:complete len:285 (+),score=38.03 TRINITY_DN9839_c0_g2_i4:972-1826(+)